MNTGFSAPLARAAWGRVVGLLSICLLMTACAGTRIDSTTRSGFLAESYERLEPVESADSAVRFYRYVSPDFDRSKYTAVLIDPVMVYQPAGGADQAGVSDDTIYRTRLALDRALRDELATRARFVSEPASGAVRLSVALTGASVQGAGFGFRDLMPLRAVYRAASSAVGRDKRAAMLMVEVRVADSTTGRTLVEAVSLVSGDQIRDRALNEAQFEALALKWVEAAVDLAQR